MADGSRLTGCLRAALLIGVGVMFAFIALGMIIGGATTLGEAQQARGNLVSAVAEVVDTSSHTPMTNSGNTSYSATVRFVVDGDAVETPLRGSRSTAFQVGEQVEISYDRNNPRVAFLRSAEEGVADGIIGLVVGSAIAVGLVAAVIWGIRLARQ